MKDHYPSEFEVPQLYQGAELCNQFSMLSSKDKQHFVVLHNIPNAYQKQTYQLSGLLLISQCWIDLNLKVNGSMIVSKGFARIMFQSDGSVKDKR